MRSSELVGREFKAQNQFRAQQGKTLQGYAGSKPPMWPECKEQWRRCFATQACLVLLSGIFSLFLTALGKRIALSLTARQYPRHHENLNLALPHATL